MCVKCLEHRVHSIKIAIIIQSFPGEYVHNIVAL